MKTYNLILALPLMLASATVSAEQKAHQPHNLFMLQADQLEWRTPTNNEDDEDLLAWKVSGWYGQDAWKLVLASEGERSEEGTESAELQLGAQMPVSPYWNLQAGWRRDLQPDDPNRDWGYVSLSGTAPYFVETEATLFVGSDTRTNLRLDVEKELMLTQRLVLIPEIEANLYSKEDLSQGAGKGLSSVEAGLRLAYEIRRQFAPYVGVHWEKLYGDTAELASDSEETFWVAGLKLWY